jgi:tetrahydromethanopterin S-methyltransferase subunit C
MPEGKFKTLWNMMLIWLLLYIALAHPFLIAFGNENNSKQRLLDWGVDLFFMADILVKFITAYEEQDGTI